MPEATLDHLGTVHISDLPEACHWHRGFKGRLNTLIFGVLRGPDQFVVLSHSFPSPPRRRERMLAQIAGCPGGPVLAPWRGQGLRATSRGMLGHLTSGQARGGGVG